MRWKKNTKFGVYSLSKRLFTLFYLSLILSALSSFPLSGLSTSSPFTAQDQLQIITTISISADITQNIVGDHAEVTSIVSGISDIHDFPGPDTTQMQQMATADLLITMGNQDLEPWLADTLATLGSSAPPILSLIEPSMIQADPLINNALNPHVWMDPHIVQRMASKITAELTNFDPIHSADYTQNNATYYEKLDLLALVIMGNRSIFEGMKVVVWHPSFTYLFNLLGVNQTAAIEKVEGEEPSVAYISQIIQMMQRENIFIIVAQPQSALEDVYTFARDAGAQIALLTPLLGVNDQNGQRIDTYIDMIEYDLWALAHPSDPPKDNTFFGSISGYSLQILLGSIAMFICVWSILFPFFNKGRISRICI